MKTITKETRSSKAGAATVLDRQDATPLYHQIFLALRDQIMTGERRFGAALPTEFQLAEQFDVSRITARRVLDELARHKLVERRRRTGTRVIFRSPIEPIEANIEQAMDTLIAFGRNTKVRVLEIAEETADAMVRESLALPEGARVVRAVRVRLLDGEPLGSVISYVPIAMKSLITRSNLTTLPMLGLLRRAGYQIGGAQQTICALVADHQLAATLSIETRGPVLRVTRVVSDTKGEPLLLTVAQYRGDRYKISLNLQGVHIDTVAG